MAHLYKQKGSHYWWLCWINPKHGKRERISTKLDSRNKARTRDAKMMLAQYQAKEFTKTGSREQDTWDAWVPTLFRGRYASNANAYDRMARNWSTLEEFFNIKSIERPTDLTRDHCFLYVDWRKQKNPKINLNTVLGELECLRVVMNEAISRQLCNHNPAAKLGIAPLPRKVRPEITEEEIKKIRTEISQLHKTSRYHADFIHMLRVTFEVAIHQGCRLAETRFHLYDDIDLENRTIQFLAKGGRLYRTALHPKLIPLIEELRAEGRQLSHDRYDPKGWSKRWGWFFERIGLEHLCFHSTRVTAISRLERAGAPESVVMQLVNHASTTVHRVYRRHTRGELDKFWH